MDAYKRLKAEISGIEGQIKSYTDDDIIVNYINQLKKAIEDTVNKNSNINNSFHHKKNNKQTDNRRFIG